MTSGDADNRALDGIRVMVIDDSKTIRRSAEAILSKAGCDVMTAEDGFQALAMIAQRRPHVIFVDIMMPRLTGYQTCTLIRNNKAYDQISMVLLSSKDGLYDKAKAQNIGVEEYLTKPFSRGELLEAVRRYAVCPTGTDR